MRSVGGSQGEIGMPSPVRTEVDRFGTSEWRALGTVVKPQSHITNRGVSGTDAFLLV